MVSEGQIFYTQHTDLNSSCSGDMTLGGKMDPSKAKYTLKKANIIQSTFETLVLVRSSMT